MGSYNQRRHIDTPGGVVVIEQYKISGNIEARARHPSGGWGVNYYGASGARLRMFVPERAGDTDRAIAEFLG